MKFVFAILISIGFISCKKRDNHNSSIEPAQWNMTKVDGNGSGIVNQLIPLLVYYPTSSGCDILDSFTQSYQGNIILIKAFGHTNTSSICTQDASIKTKTFNFEPIAKGTYELRFVNKDNSYISHMLIVN